MLSTLLVAPDYMITENAFYCFIKVKLVIYHLKLRSKFVHALIVEYMVIVWLNLSVGFVDGI